MLTDSLKTRQTPQSPKLVFDRICGVGTAVCIHIFYMTVNLIVGESKSLLVFVPYQSKKVSYGKIRNPLIDKFKFYARNQQFLLFKR